MKTELEPNVQKLLGGGWKEGVGQYIDKLEDKDKETQVKKAKNRQRG